MTPARALTIGHSEQSILKQLKSSPKARLNRCNIISSNLCDHVIQHLALSLEPHRGCTIIDINPGAGLWSSKLHEHLKPRSHVLMEEKQDVFLPLLSPLLDAPGSRYLLRDWHDKDQWQPQKYIDEGLILSPEAWKKQGHRGSPILILANLADQKFRSAPSHREPTTKGHRSHIKAIDLTHAVRMKSAFQAYGPTRILMWMPDAEKRNLVPRSVGYRGKLAVYMESTFHLEEVAGAEASPAKIRRQDYLDAESSKLVQKRMKESGIKIPPGREAKAMDNALTSTTTRAWHTELAELEEGFENQTLSQFVGKPPGPIIPQTSGPKAVRLTPEYKRYTYLKRVYKNQDLATDRLNRMLYQQEEIDNLDLAAHRDGISPSSQASEFQTIDAKIVAYKDSISSLTVNDHERLIFLDDNRRAFSLSPPLLSWDRRTADPLIIRPKEFYPPKELALLDFQPLPPEKQFPMTSDQSLYFDVLCTHLLSPRGSTTLEHLNRVAPGAYEALVPKCPAITDPRKGGRRDVGSLRLRNLTPEMLWQLAVAFDEWLFKPSMSDLLTQFGVNFDSNRTYQRRSSIRTL